eukprot:12414734-Karenia_brevis.AAC.1
MAKLATVNLVISTVSAEGRILPKASVHGFHGAYAYVVLRDNENKQVQGNFEGIFPKCEVQDH